MVLEKRPEDDGRTVVVTFSHPITDGTDTVTLVGDFNDWSEDAEPMKLDSSSCSCSVRLEPGRTYRFRYLVDGTRWENDWQADRYVPNDFGGDDSLVDLTDGMARSKTRAKKTTAPKATATKKAPAKKAPVKKAAAKKAAPKAKKPAPPAG